MKNSFPPALVDRLFLLGGKETETKEKKQILNQFERQFQAQNWILTEFAHELRTPLALLKNYFETFETDADHKAPGLRILESAFSLLDQTATLLHHPEESPTPFTLLSMPDLVAEVVDQFRPLAPKHQMVFHPPKRLIQIRGDEHKIRELIKILLENAIKYTPPGGLIDLYCTSSRTNMILKVQDTGEGVDKSWQKKIFQPFFRASTSQSGAGLGLAIAKKITEAHSGSIGVLSSRGRGSCFWVKVGLAESKETD